MNPAVQAHRRRPGARSSGKAASHVAAVTASLALALMALALLPQSAEATPIYAIRSANACDTCHIEPMGWVTPDVPQRLCSLDCTGCHVSPTGGGMRTPSGMFYGKEVLPTWGSRPSKGADPRKYKPEGYPEKGRYRLWEGFSGWWPGSLTLDQIPDRFGTIDPNPTFRVGADLRFMTYVPDNDDVKAFPMQTDLYIMGKPVEKLTVYANAGLRGRKDDPYGDKQESAADYFIAREVFIKGGQFDYNSYARVGRFNPAYGWRIPDHTTFSRRNLGFGENRQVFGAEIGMNPNYVYANAAGFYQGLDGWPGDDEPTGYGGTFTAGWRDLGWQVGTSLHYLQREEVADDLIMGLQWGLNLYPAVYLGQVDMRMQSAHDAAGTDNTSLFAYHEVNFLLTRGVNAKLKYDWQDPTSDFKDDHFHRVTTAVEWHPYTSTHMEAQYRLNYQQGKNPITDAADVDVGEFLLMLHAWF